MLTLRLNLAGSAFTYPHKAFSIAFGCCKEVISREERSVRPSSKLVEMKIDRAPAPTCRSAFGLAGQVIVTMQLESIRVAWLHFIQQLSPPRHLSSSIEAAFADLQRWVDLPALTDFHTVTLLTDGFCTGRPRYSAVNA